MEIKEGRPLQLLPPAPGRCQVCAEAQHGPEMPHNRDSMYYQFKFHAEHGRSPTWADAAADCGPEMKARLRAHLANYPVSEEAIGNL